MDNLQDLQKLERERRDKLVDFIQNLYENDAKEFCILVTRRSDNKLEYNYSEIEGNILGYLSFCLESIKLGHELNIILRNVIKYLDENNTIFRKN